MWLSVVGFLGALVFGILTAPLAADAQPAGKKVPRIGYFWPNYPLSKTSPRLEVFRQGLHDLDWVEGENVAIEYRWGEGRTERFRDLATELV